MVSALMILTRHLEAHLCPTDDNIADRTELLPQIVQATRKVLSFAGRVGSPSTPTGSPSRSRTRPDTVNVSNF